MTSTGAQRFVPGFNGPPSGGRAPNVSSERRSTWCAFALVCCACSGAGEPESAPEEPSPAPSVSPVVFEPLGSEVPLTPLAADAFAQTIQENPGKVVLVNLWSTWCAPCMEEMPMLVDVVRERAPRGLGAVFVSMDMASNEEAAQTFMAQTGAPSPSFMRSGRDTEFIHAVHSDWTGTLPATLVFDEAREVRHLFVGEVDRETIEAALDALL